MIAGTITARTPASYTYTTTDWRWWEEYAKNKVEFEPILHNDGYKHLAKILQCRYITKTATAHSKK